MRCRQCAGACEWLGYKTPIPPRYKAKAWDALFTYVNESRRARLESAARWNMKQKLDLAKRIEKMERLPANKDRATAIKTLRKRLESLRT